MGQKPGRQALPVKGSLSHDVALTIIVTVLLAVVSGGSLVFSARVYPTEELFRSFAANDVINIVIGVPILLGSIWLSRRGQLVGLLLWPGAVLYVLYNYIVYVFGIPFNVLTIAYLLIVVLCGFIIIDLLRKIEMDKIGGLLAGHVPVRFASGVLLLFGFGFIFRALSIIIDAVATQAKLPSSEVGLLISDVIISTIWVGGGITLLRRKSIGYVGGLGLLFTGSMLFIGLILVLCMNPFFLDSEFILSDVLVVSIMGLICFIPFGLYLRGVIRRMKE